MLGSPAGFQEREKQAEKPIFSVISRIPWEVGTRWMEGGRDTGGMSTLKTKKTASRTGTPGEWMGGDKLDNPVPSF